MKFHQLLLATACLLGLATAQETLPYTATPDLGQPGAYKFDGTTVHVELSQYAGYCGLILANGGMKGTSDSYIFKKHKIKFDFSITEKQDWSKVNSGKIAFATTTADVLAAYRNRLSCQVTNLIDYSRGADEIVALKSIHSVRDLVGKTVVVTMFDETEFFIRKLCYDNSLEVQTRDSVASPPSKTKVNLIFSPTSDEIPKLFAKLSADPSTGVVACATWLPFTTDAVTESKGRAAVLMTNKNQLFIADVMIANQAFCDTNPQAVLAINDALVYGNRELQKLIDQKTGNDNLWSLLTTSLTVDPSDPYDRETLHGELTRIQFSTARLNAEFLGGDTRVGAGFNEIFADASKFYSEKVAGPERPYSFVDPKVVAGFVASPFYDKNEAALQSIATSGHEKPEMDAPTVKRNFHFRFALGVYDKFDLEKGDNGQEFTILERAIKSRPGSIIRLIGHLDTSKIKENGPEFAKKYGPMAKKSSLDRAETIKKLLASNLSVPEDRFEATGLGWDSPISQVPIENARVEVEIFALE